MDRGAVGDLAAVAATLADVFVDHDPGGRGLDGASFATTSKFGSTRLVIDQHSHAIDLAEFSLHSVEFVSVFNACVRCEHRAFRILVDVVGNHHDLRDTLGRE